MLLAVHSGLWCLALAAADPVSFAIGAGWRWGLLFAAWCVTEHQMHVWVLHCKRFFRYVYDWHHVEHHGRGMNDLTPHIDNGWDAYVAPIVSLPVFIAVAQFRPQAWILIFGLAVSVPLHRYVWNHIHRGIHRTHDHLFSPYKLAFVPAVLRGERLEHHWLHRTWFFPALERHHLIHHGCPNKNYSVVFAPYTDWVFGSLAGVRPWWKFFQQPER